MANNRIYIRCRGCNKYLMIGKHFAGPYKTMTGIEERLDDFFKEHTWCNEEGFGDYDIVYEIDEQNLDREI